MYRQIALRVPKPKVGLEFEFEFEFECARFCCLFTSPNYRELLCEQDSVGLEGA